MQHKPFPLIKNRKEAYPLMRGSSKTAYHFFDGAGGTQVPTVVQDAMVQYLSHHNSNQGGYHKTSLETDHIVDQARQKLARLFNAKSPNEICFGANMTSITLNFSRCLARLWQENDEIIISDLDHEANRSPWVSAASEKGINVRSCQIKPQDGTLDLDHLRKLLSPKTKLVAVTLASNLLGTFTPIKDIIEEAHKVGAFVYVDAVHAAPHCLIDVQDLNCDFLVCSPYKFFGPHLGVLWGKGSLLQEIPSYRIMPAPKEIPGKWESGTPNFEAIAGTGAAIDYLTSLCDTHQREELPSIRDAMKAIQLHEQKISEYFLSKVSEYKNVKLFGISDVSRAHQRTPTFSLSIDGYSPAILAQKLADKNIYAWSGHCYAVTLSEKLGYKEGFLRVGYNQYHDLEDVDLFFELIQDL